MLFWLLGWSLSADRLIISTFVVVETFNSGFQAFCYYSQSDCFIHKKTCKVSYINHFTFVCISSSYCLMCSLLVTPTPAINKIMNPHSSHIEHCVHICQTYVYTGWCVSGKQHPVANAGNDDEYRKYLLMLLSSCREL